MEQLQARGLGSVQPSLCCDVQSSPGRRRLLLHAVLCTIALQVAMTQLAPSPPTYAPTWRSLEPRRPARQKRFLISTIALQCYLMAGKAVLDLYICHGGCRPRAFGGFRSGQKLLLMESAGTTIATRG